MPYALRKTDLESRLYNMDFAPKMTTGELITSVTSVVSSPSGLTISEISYSGQIAQVRIAAGTPTTDYSVVWLVVTDLGNTLEAVGILNVVAAP